MKYEQPSNRGATTLELVMKYADEKNPVTRSVYKQIIANRIERELRSDRERNT